MKKKEENVYDVLVKWWPDLVVLENMYDKVLRRATQKSVDYFFLLQVQILTLIEMY